MNLEEIKLKYVQSHSIVVQFPNGQKNVTEDCLKAVWAWLMNEPSQTAVVTTPDKEMYAVSFKMEKLHSDKD